MSITKYEAQTASEFHHVSESQGSGTQCARVRRNGRTQVWVTRPAEFRLPVKFGIRARDQFSITETDAQDWTVANRCLRCNGLPSGFIGKRIWIEKAERLRMSTNGNPRFKVTYTTEFIRSEFVTVQTQSDASVSYDIDNALGRSGRGKLYFALFSRAGRMTNLFPALSRETMPTTR